MQETIRPLIRLTATQALDTVFPLYLAICGLKIKVVSIGMGSRTVTIDHETHEA